MSIADIKADGTYWAVEFPAWTFPCHFNPPALDLDRVRKHWPQAGDKSRKITGAEYLKLADKLAGHVEAA